MCGGTHGSPWDILHRTVGRDRHIGLTCVVVHMGVPWDILSTSNIGQWDGIDS